MAKANSHVVMNMMVGDLIKTTEDSLCRQIALMIATDENSCWETFVDGLWEQEKDFVADAVEDNLETMDDFINALEREYDADVLVKYIEINWDICRFGEKPSVGNICSEIRFSFSFDWEKYREDKAKGRAV